MSRRHSAEKREVIPDAKFGDVILTKFMNSIMYDGKKSIAEAIVYDAFDIIEQKMRSEPLPVFKQALDNVAPSIEVRSRRVGGATYQVPVEVRAERRQALAIPIRRRRGGRDRDATFLLLLHPIHGGRAVMDFADLMRFAGIIENPLCRRRLARVDMGHDAEVPVILDRMAAGHDTIPSGGTLT